ncbi:hypothetical protein PITCH_A1580055 [uncultured Desulfobacterium sp.]|uniref:Uncharacterized protein n=1 Tax=uncultured Desulfobacterium sp. TaxID=201089 RepID=A0A445MTV4_9BACT|nr:hypothetical protein PITCH_A1580055 [uncultured Desulfobacterium sp.]
MCRDYGVADPRFEVSEHWLTVVFPHATGEVTQQVRKLIGTLVDPGLTIINNYDKYCNPIQMEEQGCIKRHTSDILSRFKSFYWTTFIAYPGRNASIFMAEPPLDGSMAEHDFRKIWIL